MATMKKVHGLKVIVARMVAVEEWLGKGVETSMLAW
jgi:hypothetical protein